MTDLYTTSRLRVFNECQRKHLYRYQLGIKTPSTPAMEFGTRLHAVLEAWYRAWQAGVDRLAIALAAVDALEACDEVDRIKLRVLVAAYEARWGAEDWEILAVEVGFRYFLGDIEIGGKLDALIRERATGRVFVVEHKSSTADTSPGSPYWDKLALDLQVSIYVDGAAAGLDYEIAGCVYDVIKRPMHEPLQATPLEARKYTVGKGCKKCGGSAKAGAVQQGRGTYTVSFVTVEEITCDECDGTGWKKDKEGAPEAPRLHSNQRAEDESLEAYAERLADEVAQRVDDFLSRGVIVRLDSELPQRRQELLDTIAVMQLADEAGLAPPNHGACVRGRDTCSFFSACSGRASIEDVHIFPRGQAHPELERAA